MYDHHQNQTIIQNETILADKLENAYAVGFLHKRQMLFWTEARDESRPSKITRKFLKEESKSEVIVSTGLVRPEGLAVDWLTEKIYWTDSYNKFIEVANIDGSQRHILFSKTNLDEPICIVVDPIHG